ncbi:MAG: hypothetical protein ACLFPQ_05855 [Candidatus Woesearchaeota archaeon]
MLSFDIVKKAKKLPDKYLFLAFFAKGLAGLGLGIVLAANISWNRWNTFGWTMFFVAILLAIPIWIKLFTKKK